MRFAIKDKVYDAASVDDVSLRDVVLFETQTEQMGQKVTWPEVEQWVDEVNAMKTEKEKERHPKAVWLFAITVWATRRNSGEMVSFDEAVNIPMKDLRVLPDTADRQAPANPTKRATASSPAAARRPRAAAARKRPSKSR